MNKELKDESSSFVLIHDLQLELLFRIIYEIAFFKHSHPKFPKHFFPLSQRHPQDT